MDGFPGLLFGESVPDGRATATLIPRPGQLEVVTHAGDRFSLPGRELTLERGGDQGKHWYCKAAGLTAVSDAPGLAEALSEIDSEVAETVAAVSSQANKRRRAGRFGCLIALSLCLVGLFFLPTCYRWGVERAATALPDSVDEQLGSIGWSQMSSQLREHPDETIQAVADEMLEVVRQGLDDPDRWQLDVVVVEEDQINAFALPGGQMVIYSGLMAAAEDPDEVAAVLAHEIGHIEERHGVKRIAHAVGIAAGFQLFLGDIAGILALAPELLQIASLNDYSQHQEHEADETGVRLCHATGVDPFAMATFFERLREEHGDTPAFLGWLSTHPSHSDRIEHVEALVNELGPGAEAVGWSFDWPSVKARLEPQTAQEQTAPEPAPAAESEGN